MLPKGRLHELGNDIKANGLKNPIIVWRGEDGEEWLIDGRNRLEAMELVRIELDPSRIECVAGGNPVSLIQTLNLRRRHLSKHQQAVLNVKMLKAQRAWEKAKAKGQKRTPQVEEVSKGGRGRVNELKAEAVAICKEQDISESTVERAMAEVEGRKPKARSIIPRAEDAGVVDDAVEPKGRKRRTKAEGDRDSFVERFMPRVHGLGMVTYRADVLGLLTAEQKTAAVEDIDAAIAALTRNQLREGPKVDRCGGVLAALRKEGLAPHADGS
jgi:hypothetical protein